MSSRQSTLLLNVIGLTVLVRVSVVLKQHDQKQLQEEEIRCHHEGVMGAGSRPITLYMYTGSRGERERERDRGVCVCERGGETERERMKMREQEVRARLQTLKLAPQ